MCGLEQLDAFYEVFSHNMRELDATVFSRQLFSSILSEHPGRWIFAR